MSGRRLRLAIGDWLDFEDERHQVTGLVGTSVRLRSQTGAAQLIAAAELLAQATPAAGRATASTGGLDPGAVLDDLPAAERQRVLDLAAHLLEATTGYRSGDPAAAGPGEPRPQFDPARTQQDRVTAKAAELGLTGRRVWQLLDAWRGQGLWGLVDKRKTRPRNPLAGLDPRIVSAIRDQYTAEIGDSAGTIGNRFRRRVQNRLDAAHGTGVVVLPAKRGFYRAVALLTDHPPTGPTATRRTTANQPDRAFGQVLAQRPGQVVMLDSTPLDVIAYDPVLDSTDRVELTIAIDVATRSLLSWRLTPEGTKAVDVGLLIADALTPEPMRPGWPDTLRFSAMRIGCPRVVDIDQRLAQAAARPVIYPETIIIDHGKPYQSDVLHRACQRLGISIADARRLKPTDKPAVEATFRTIRLDFSEHVAGYKGYDVAHRGRDADAVARWSIAELEEFFAEYVIAVYQRRHHDGLILPGFPDLRLSPNDAYALAIAHTGYITCPTDPTLYYELLPIAWRTIQPYGLEIDHLVYWADVLLSYRKSRSPYRNGLWPVRHDPRNRLHAYFHDPADGTWHQLRWTHALDEHLPFTDITLREATKLATGRGCTPPDQHDIAAALRDLQNRTDAPESWTRTDRKRLARDAERARAAARDRSRGAPPAAGHPPTGLHLVSTDPDPDPTVDLADLQPLEVWNPHHPPQES